jgi:hypothetical protein
MKPTPVTHHLLKLSIAPLAILLLAVAPAVGQNATGTITASETLLRIPAGQLGTTSITWATSGYTTAQVYLANPDGSETLFGQAPSYSGASAPWIQPGVDYTFRLYANTTKTVLLDSVMVRGVFQTGNGTVTANQTLLYIPSGQMGTASISWVTFGYSTAQVYLANADGTETLFGHAPSYSGASAPWIQPGVNYTFRLYANTTKTVLLDSVMVRGVLSTFNNNARLRVISDGSLQLDGKPYSGVEVTGVNYYDAFNRVLENSANTSYIAGFQGLNQKGIRHARLDITGYWPIRLQLFWSNRTAYWQRLDGVVAAAEANNVGLIFSMIWNPWVLSDLAGEHLDQWAVPNSLTRQKMREYVTAVVDRYKNSRTVWAWELGNEWNLGFDLPNATEWLPPIQPTLGTPTTRDPVRDIFPTKIARPGMIEFANIIRGIDPIRPITTGHASPRPSQWNQYHYLTWTADTPAQSREITLYHTPAPFDMISVHLYNDDHLKLSNIQQAALSKQIALYSGEFGDPEPDTSLFRNRARLSKAYSSLGAVWVYDLPQQTADYSITTTNARSWMLDAMKVNAYPAIVPGVVEAENFDNGGQGVSFNDTTSTNDGGKYRTTEGVDIETCSDTGGGFNVGWITNNEWLQYTLKPVQGSYNITFRVAAWAAGGQIRVKLDGVDLGTVNVPVTGGAQTWTDVTLSNVQVNNTSKFLRLEFLGANFNLNKVSLSLVPLPAPWVNADIGGPGVAGSASQNAGTFVLNASGTNIWDPSDQFHFVSQPSTADCSITARVLSVQNTNPWAKTGVMIRESTAANAMNMSVFVTPSNGIRLQWRSATGGATTPVTQAGLAAPYWVRLTRTGNIFTAFYSSNGSTWTQLGTPQTIPMAGGALIGLASSSLVNTVLGTNTISNVTPTP